MATVRKLHLVEAHPGDVVRCKICSKEHTLEIIDPAWGPEEILVYRCPKNGKEYLAAINGRVTTVVEKEHFKLMTGISEF